MRTSYSLLIAAVTLLASCSGGGGEPEELAALDGSVVCKLSADGPNWEFPFAVSGPAAELGTVVYIDFNTIEGGNWFSTFSGRGRKGKKRCKSDY